MTAGRKWKGRGRWYSAARRHCIARDGPGCAGCGVEGVPLELDHVRPVEAGGPEWDLENLHQLCKICHRAKTAREARARAARRRTVHGLAVLTSRRW